VRDPWRAKDPITIDRVPNLVTTRKQRAAAKRNIEKAAKAARRKRTIAHLSKKTRTALGKREPKLHERNEPEQIKVDSTFSNGLIAIGVRVEVKASF
jgi:hypothetical protein